MENMQEIFTAEEWAKFRVQRTDLVEQNTFTGFWGLNYDVAIALFNDVVHGDFEVKPIKVEFIPGTDVLLYEGEMTVRHNGKEMKAYDFGTAELQRDKCNKEIINNWSDIHKMALKDFKKRVLRETFELGLAQLSELNKEAAKKDGKKNYSNQQQTNQPNQQIRTDDAGVCADCGAEIQSNFTGTSNYCKYKLKLDRTLCTKCQKPFKDALFAARPAV